MLNRSSRTPPVLGSWWFDFTSTSLRAFLPGPAMTWRRVDWWFRNVDWTMGLMSPNTTWTYQNLKKESTVQITIHHLKKSIETHLLRSPKIFGTPSDPFFLVGFSTMNIFSETIHGKKTLEIHPNFSPEAALSKLPGQSKARVSQVFFIEPLMDHGYHSYVKLPEGSRGYKQQHHVGLLMEYAMLRNSICSKMGKSQPTCVFSKPRMSGKIR